MGLVQASLQLMVPSPPTQGSPGKADLAGQLRRPHPACPGGLNGDLGLSPPPVSRTWKLRPCPSPSQEAEGPDGSRGDTQATRGALSGPARHTQRERPSLRAGGVGGADSADPSPEPSGAWTSARPPPTARSGRGHHCARYPNGETEAWRGAVLCKVTRGCRKLRPPAPRRVPRGAPSPASLPGRCSREAQRAHRARTGKARLTAPGRPTLMTTAQVAVAAAASGSGSALLTASRVPARSAAASSPPRSREGGADGRGWGWGRARAPPARPGSEGHPSFPTLPTALLAPGTRLRARARAQNRRAHRRAHAAVIGAGCPATERRLGPGGPAAPSLRAAGQGTRPPEPPFPPWRNGNSNCFCVRELFEN